MVVKIKDTVHRIKSAIILLGILLIFCIAGGLDTDTLTEQQAIRNAVIVLIMLILSFVVHIKTKSKEITE